MGFYNKNNSRSGRGDFRARDEDRGNRQMHKVVCGDCGKDCEVPFKPTGSKPVYCSECFEKMGGKNERRPSFGRPRFNDRKPSFDLNKSQLDSINQKLDKILLLLEPKKTLPKKNKIADPVDSDDIKNEESPLVE